MVTYTLFSVLFLFFKFLINSRKKFSTDAPTKSMKTISFVYIFYIIVGGPLSFFVYTDSHGFLFSGGFLPDFAYNHPALNIIPPVFLLGLLILTVILSIRIWENNSRERIVYKRMALIFLAWFVSLAVSSWYLFYYLLCLTVCFPY